ncbi:hypothetical protein MTR_5g464510 [Medicago truncatula]|uniref:Uncharacterized protein n=1 Tax=Medicago truncatula TaxID=3880 RepID=A0A072UF58_MEDTR|nr:hypothetical protein MTR_5g464510 [Medicago truncatula]
MGELKPTETTLKLFDRSDIQPVGYVDDIPVKIEGIYIPTDFMVLDIDGDNECPIILGRPFLATAGAIVDVQNVSIVFQVSDELIGFELENFMKGAALYSCNMIKGNCPSMIRENGKFEVPLSRTLARPCQTLPSKNPQNSTDLARPVLRLAQPCPTPGTDLPHLLPHVYDEHE